MLKILLTIVIGLCLSVNAFAQQINVKGLVKDTFGEPFIGANVLIKGTVTGTMEDIST